ncbi:MAG: hypothetical protein HY716_02035 [Planctomycetes bacterium]|nr:hypothetical protein [Planctomycetota bacterium]
MKRLCGTATVIALFAAMLPLGAQEAQDEAGPSIGGIAVQVQGQDGSNLDGQELSDVLNGLDLPGAFGQMTLGQDGSVQGFTVQLRGGPFTMDKLAFDELAPEGGTGFHNNLGGLFGGGSGFGLGGDKE